MTDNRPSVRMEDLRRRQGTVHWERYPSSHVRVDEEVPVVFLENSRSYGSTSEYIVFNIIPTVGWWKQYLVLN